MSRYEEPTELKKAFNKICRKLTPAAKEDFSAYFNDLNWSQKNMILQVMDKRVGAQNYSAFLGEELMNEAHGWNKGYPRPDVMKALTLAGADQKVVYEGKSVYRVDYFDEYGVNAELCLAQRSNALMRAIEERIDPSTVSDMIDRHPNVNARDAFGVTALMRAVKVSDLPAAKKLVAKGAKIKLRDKEGNSLADYARTSSPAVKAFVTRMSR